MAPALSQQSTVDSDVVAFLKRPDTHGGCEVTFIETHGNLILLAGEGIYKVKRAVAFSYMGFSTLEKRRRACEREVSLDRLWAPDLYLGCVPITRGDNGALAFGGQARPLNGPFICADSIRHFS